MSTVIVGGGIIGVSIAYFLSDPDIQSNQQREIHIVDSSPELFACASGKAAGFLARDWFSPELQPLGALSFDLHRQLAAQHSGGERWGYMQGSAVSLQVVGRDGKKTARGDDWLRRGASRAEAAIKDTDKDSLVTESQDPSPAWLTKQNGGTVEKISNDSCVAQIDPLRLCQFMTAKCIERGVRIHNPARVVSALNDAASGVISEVVIEDTKSHIRSNVPCTNLVFAAGPWTPRAFGSVFPLSKAHIPVLALSGYSLVFRSPRHTLHHEQETYGGKSHAVFTTYPQSCGFSSEIFARANAEIYLAGLNGLDIPLPEVATDAEALMTKDKTERVREAARVLMGRPQENPEEANIDDLEVLRESLCFRPYIESGLPIVARLKDEITGSAARVSGGVFMATGHGPWGISLCLGTGKVMAEMISGIEPSVDVTADMPGDGSGYDDSHRAFLQAFMARSTMTLEEAKPVLAAIFTVSEGREILPGDITQTDLNTYIAATNTAISGFDLEIRSTVHQTQQSRVYALINSTSDPLMQLATTYTADEIAYVKRLLDAMFESNNTSRCEAMVVSSIEAVRLARVTANNTRRQSEATSQGGTAQPLSMKDAEDMLKRLVAEGWLERSRQSYYSLTPRALMELRGWLVETYNDEEDEDDYDRDTPRNDKIKMCFACKEIITVVRTPGILSAWDKIIFSCSVTYDHFLGPTMLESSMLRTSAPKLHPQLLPIAAG
ncbi:FAD dependent oxidoreductase [Arthroderma uncinatum]|uniref:FAD dependent oxidoreductase n=1 Tax=Arthroderma uncinatum TaxID=74035 RepID=UPI00144A7B1D|nr:FAD dependent oxidoreductase [Arthroderma uncinatum]KAF3480970.1 FAD dependent oxidoreductase [Arthroderma uncinatum]